MRGTTASVFIRLNWKILVFRHHEANYGGVGSGVVCSGIRSCVPGIRKAEFKEWQLAKICRGGLE